MEVQEFLNIPIARRTAKHCEVLAVLNAIGIYSQAL